MAVGKLWDLATYQIQGLHSSPKMTKLQRITLQRHVLMRTVAVGRLLPRLHVRTEWLAVVAK